MIGRWIANDPNGAVNMSVVKQWRGKAAFLRSRSLATCYRQLITSEFRRRRQWIGHRRIGGCDRWHWSCCNCYGSLQIGNPLWNQSGAERWNRKSQPPLKLFDSWLIVRSTEQQIIQQIHNSSAAVLNIVGQSPMIFFSQSLTWNI